MTFDVLGGGGSTVMNNELIVTVNRRIPRVRVNLSSESNDRISVIINTTTTTHLRKVPTATSRTSPLFWYCTVVLASPHCNRYPSGASFIPDGNQDSDRLAPADIS